MTLLFIALAIAFTIAMTVMMIGPFTRDRSEQLSMELLDEKQRQIEALVSRKVALVQSLRDIEYDWKTDKISREDYERFRKSCERQAVGIMRRLDGVHGDDRNWEDVIDRAVAERLDDGEQAASADEHPADGETAHSDSTPDTAERSCPGCGRSLDPDDRFCSRCGTPVEPTENSSSADHSGRDEFTPLTNSSSSSEVAG